MPDLERYKAETPRPHVLARSVGGKNIHLVPNVRIEAAAAEEGPLRVRAECSIRSTWTPVTNQARAKHSPEDVCRNCIRTAVSRGHITNADPFRREVLDLK